MISLYYFVIVPVVGAVLGSFANKQNKTPKNPYIIALVTLFICLGMTINNFLLIKSGAALQREIFAGEFIFGSLMLFMVYGVALAVCVYAWASEKTKVKGIFYGLILTASAGMCGIIINRDFFVTYVFLEVVSACSFTMIAFYDNEEATEGAIRYFYLSALASVFIVFSLAILFLAVGSTTFEALIALLQTPSANKGLVNIFLGVLTIGFMIKTGLVPFHTWVPDAYQAASSSVSAFLAGIITKAAGAYTLIKIAMLMGLASHFTTVSASGKAIMVFGALSIVFGAFLALRQTNLKRVLAYSSISQMGYIFLAAGLGTPLGLAGAVFHLFNHATFKTTLFFTAGSLEAAAGSCNIKELYGLEKQMPVTSAFTLTAMLSTAGIPPLSGFWSKLIIVMALWQAGYYTFAAIAIFASVISLAYCLRVYRNVFWGRADGEMKKVKEVSLTYLLPSGVFVAIMVAAGLYFPFIYNSFIEPFVRGLK